MSKRPIRIANFSGALGDYLGAFADAVRGEPVDVVIGDYLAEMTMGRVAEGFVAKPAALPDYYVPVFLAQLEPLLDDIAARKLKVVVNAGAFNPKGMTDAIAKLIAEKQSPLRVACVRGDDLLQRVPELVADGQLANMDTGASMGNLAGRLMAANAYLGAWGIVEALRGGADIVICGRVTDASLAMGPAAWWHDWSRDDWNALAGACAAGHIIECGPQAVGGNFSGFTDLPEFTRLGFPIAEIAANGESVITKRQADGGAVTPDTVVAQLMYEIQGPLYLNPDVVLHIDSVDVTLDAPDRVRVANVKGEPPPDTTKVSCFYHNGFRTSFYTFVTGIDFDQKVAWLRRQMAFLAGSLRLDEFHFDVLGRPCPDPASKAEATVAIRIAAAAQDVMELKRLRAGYSSFGLGGIPGFYGEGSGETPARVEYWPALVRQTDVTQEVVFDDGRIASVGPSSTAPFHGQRSASPPESEKSADAFGPAVERPLADVVFARSGDKGGNANLGVWCRRAEGYAWLLSYLTEARLRALLDLPETMGVERYPLANVRGLYFVLRGYFGESGAGNVGLDQIGKAVGEHLRARVAPVPAALVA